MVIVIVLIFCVLTALLAKRKGYNPYIWFFATGIIGLIVLAFLPFTDVETLNPEQKKAAKKKGNIIGGITVAVVIIAAMLNSLYYNKSMKILGQEKACGAKVVMIQGAVFDYSTSHSYGTKSYSYPPSLREEGVLRKFKEGRLPEHPCGKDWNDFYDPEAGRLDIFKACNCR